MLRQPRTPQDQGRRNDSGRVQVPEPHRRLRRAPGNQPAAGHDVDPLVDPGIEALEVDRIGERVIGPGVPEPRLSLTFVRRDDPLGVPCEADRFPRGLGSLSLNSRIFGCGFEKS